MFRELREAGKSLVFTSYCRTAGRAKSRRLASKGLQRVSVVCYHRVSDAFKDSVTLPVDQFAAQIALIRRHYQLATLQDVIRGEIDRRSSRPIVVITFDDGYSDNFTSAFPILSREAATACFFVSTGLIGSDRGFRHDLEKLGRAIPTMTWDQLREMQAEGQEIGAHTVSHANLAKIDEADAIRELTVSRDTIRRELKVEHMPFAYCYGGRADITERTRDLVKALGYQCCCSAFGGTNDGAIDPFNIKRFGVNWSVSEAAFRARIEGWR